MSLGMIFLIACTRVQLGNAVCGTLLAIGGIFGQVTDRA